ncbi:hypothetical protein [Yersinia intermedia]|uniref:hypothetical protein n=1 Tax=Yersinia intermedia TaxID=631 RepID=UPI0030D41A9E
MSNSVEITRIMEILRTNEERVTAHQYAIQSALAVLNPAQLTLVKELLVNTVNINDAHHRKTGDMTWLGRSKGVRRELNHIIPKLFNGDE